MILLQIVWSVECEPWHKSFEFKVGNRMVYTSPFLILI